VDLMYWTPAWIEQQLARVLDRHEASVGYSTCFWHTVRESLPLFDRDGWFEWLQARANCPYPRGLRTAIVAKNFPLLRETPFSFVHQIETAVGRDDPLTVQHRSAALLGSYFDVLFALNEVPHPGEKRLVQHARDRCAIVPTEFEGSLSRFLRTAGSVPPDAEVVSAAQALLDGLDRLLTIDDRASLSSAGSFSPPRSPEETEAMRTNEAVAGHAAEHDPARRRRWGLRAHTT